MDMSDKIKEALADYELRFHALFEQTHDAVFLLDFEGNHLEVNQRACEMFGYSKEEMLKLSYKDVSMKVESSRDNLGILLREGTLPIYESLFRRKDGSIIPVEINAVLVRTRDDKPLFIQSALRDISARKRAENEYMKRVENEKKVKALSRFQAIMMNLAIGFVNISEDRLDEAIDQTLEMVGKMYGVDRAYLLRNDEHLGAKLTNEWNNPGVVRPGEPTDINRMELPLSHDESCLGHVGFEVYSKDTKWQEESTTLLKVLALLLTNVIEKQIHENEMIKAKTEALLANEVKGNFLANMSHEFRTPLNGVIGMLGLLHKTTLDQKQKDYLDKALEFSRLLLHTLNDILDFSKIEAGMLKLEKTRFELHKIVDEVNAIVSPAIFDKGLSLTVTIPKNVPECVIGDGLRIRQILINLMSNAVKFTDKGKVGIKIEMGEAIDEGRAWFIFEITDTGIGMDPSQIENVFSPFVQADSSVTRQYGGTGLGLAIVKDLVQMMGGTVALESQPGTGSIFKVLIPLEFIEGDALDSWTVDTNNTETTMRVIMKAPLRRRSDPEIIEVKTRDEHIGYLIEALKAHKPKQSFDVLEKLEIYFLRMEDQEVMSRIKVQIKNYKFDEALILAKSLQGGIFNEYP
jgi:PAS domain S-box-containing protein